MDWCSAEQCKTNLMVQYLSGLLFLESWNLPFTKISIMMLFTKICFKSKIIQRKKKKRKRTNSQGTGLRQLDSKMHLLCRLPSFLVSSLADRGHWSWGKEASDGFQERFLKYSPKRRNLYAWVLTAVEKAQAWRMSQAMQIKQEETGTNKFLPQVYIGFGPVHNSSFSLQAA